MTNTSPQPPTILSVRPGADARRSVVVRLSDGSRILIERMAPRNWMLSQSIKRGGKVYEYPMARMVSSPDEGVAYLQRALDVVAQTMGG